MIIASLCVISGATVAQPLPAADHHQHPVSPAIVEMLSSEGDDAPHSLVASDVIAQLDAAGVNPFPATRSVISCGNRAKVAIPASVSP